MLIYHPAFDAYHCVFRMLKVTELTRRLELSKLRILDFYLCFPAEIAAIQLPKEHVEVKKIARGLKNEYRGPVSTTRTFREMEPIQLASARLLAASRLLDAELLSSGIVQRSEVVVPPALKDSLDRQNESGDAVSTYILTKMSEIPLAGLNGLKQRTGLMEYRYDVA